MVFYINDACNGTNLNYAIQEDTFVLCGNTLILTGSKYYMDDAELGRFMDALSCNCVNFQLCHAACLQCISPSGPFFRELR